MALDRGWSYGTCEPYSLKLAEKISSQIPFAEQIRFVNSGTEAVMTALRLARGFTGRNKIIKFNGCYHGHVDSMLIKAGSGLAGESEASSLGVSKQVASETLIVELNDLPALEQCFLEHRDEVAAVIIEPLPANNGLLTQDKEYLQQVQQMAHKHGALYIFDEVISGFRICFGGMAQHLDIVPDLVTYGKIIGGGMPVGALAGKKEIMQHLSPSGNVYQAGTLSANPLAMVAGLATLKYLTPSFYTQLDQQSEQVTNILSSFLQKYYPDLTIKRFASLFWIHPQTNHTINQACLIPSNLMQGFDPLFHDLLMKGIYLAPNPYEVGFVSIAHDQAILNELEQLLS